MKHDNSHCTKSVRCSRTELIMGRRRAGNLLAPCVMLYYFASYIIAQFSVRVNSLAVKFSKSSCGAIFFVFTIFLLEKPCAMLKRRAVFVLKSCYLCQLSMKILLNVLVRHSVCSHFSYHCFALSKCALCSFK